MNVLRQLTNIGLGPFPSPEPPPSSPKLARTPKTPTHIPPCSTQVLTLTGTDPSLSSQIIVGPMESTDNNIGICDLRTTATSNRGRMKVLVTNLTECDITIPPRTPIGVVSEVITTPVALHLAEAEELEPNFSRLQLPQDLPDEDQKLLDDLLKRHSDVFAWSNVDLGSSDLVQHKIILHTDVQIAEPYRRIPPHHLQEVRSQIEDLVQRGIIETSTSPMLPPL